MLAETLGWNIRKAKYHLQNITKMLKKYRTLAALVDGLPDSKSAADLQRAVPQATYRSVARRRQSLRLQKKAEKRAKRDENRVRPEEIEQFASQGGSVDRFLYRCCT